MPPSSLGATLLIPLMGIFLKFERARQLKMLEDILRRDKALGGSGLAFLYRGRMWHAQAMSKIRGAKAEPLHQALEEDFEIYLQIHDDLERDEKKLRQALSVVLGRCCNVQDVRDVLPEALVSHVDQFRGLRRTRQEGFLVEELPLLKGQFDQAVELALKYTANQLIF